MSKIERFQGDVKAFASNAQGLERTVFGGTTQANDLTSQVTAAFLRGWGIVGPSEHPSLEDFNAAMYAMSQFIAYQHQMGIPEWHEAQEYYIGSICTHSGESYQSLEDGNIGNEPPSSNWTPVLTSKNGLPNLGLGDAAKLPAPQYLKGSGYTLFKQPFFDGSVVKYFATLNIAISAPALTNGQSFPVSFPTAFSADVNAVMSDTYGIINASSSGSEGAFIRDLSNTGLIISSQWNSRTSSDDSGPFRLIVTGVMND